MANFLFTNVMDVDFVEDKKYEEPSSLSKFEEVVQTVMLEYNMKHKSKLNIVLFR